MNIYWEEHENSDRPTEFDLRKDTKIFVPKKEIGGYDITGGNGANNSITFYFVKKPSWFHRTCCRFFLGWRWRDKEEKKSGLLLG